MAALAAALKLGAFCFFLPQLHSITAENPKFGFTFTPNTFFKAGVFTNPSGRFILSKHQFSNFASGNNGLFIWGNEKPRILSSDPDHEASMGCNVANHLYQTLSYKHQNILHSSLVIQVLLIFSFYIAFKLGIPKINIYIWYLWSFHCCQEFPAECSQECVELTMAPAHFQNKPISILEHHIPESRAQLGGGQLFIFNPEHKASNFAHSELLQTKTNMCAKSTIWPHQLVMPQNHSQHSFKKLFHSIHGLAHASFKKTMCVCTSDI